MLTKPSKPCGNNGYDNEDCDYILYVNDVLGSEGNKYLILDVLGQGTFGQVVKCQNLKTHEIVGVKVIKNKEAYAQQSTMEIMILDIVSRQKASSLAGAQLIQHDCPCSSTERTIQKINITYSA